MNNKKAKRIRQAVRKHTGNLPRVAYTTKEHKFTKVVVTSTNTDGTPNTVEVPYVKEQRLLSEHCQKFYEKITKRAYKAGQLEA